MNEWVLIYLARFIACDDAELHTKLLRDIATLAPVQAGAIGAIRLDIFQVAALIEVLFPVKHAMFSIGKDLTEMMGSDPFTFAT